MNRTADTERDRNTKNLIGSLQKSHRDDRTSCSYRQLWRLDFWTACGRWNLKAFKFLCTARGNRWLYTGKSIQEEDGADISGAGYIYLNMYVLRWLSELQMVRWDLTISGSLFNSTGVALANSHLRIAFFRRMEENECLIISMSGTILHFPPTSEIRVWISTRPE